MQGVPRPPLPLFLAALFLRRALLGARRLRLLQSGQQPPVPPLQCRQLPAVVRTRLRETISGDCVCLVSSFPSEEALLPPRLIKNGRVDQEGNQCKKKKGRDKREKR